MEKTVYELFEELNPCEKATFIDARLDWASNGALCGEITIRMCNPLNDNDNAKRLEETASADESR